jgi:hypothetical protein
VSAPQEPRRVFEFGPLKFGVRGNGLFVGGPKLSAKVATLTVEQATEANRQAWKLKRQMGRTMDRYSNVTIYGSESYNAAADDYFVADAVCKATWQRVRGVQS